MSTRTKTYRRNQEKVKDLRRRFLYRNHAINGRYELDLNKEDDSVSELNTNNYGESHWSKVTVNPKLLDNKTGHWQEYPKTRNHGEKGYYRKKGYKAKAFKERVLDELIEKEKNDD